MSEKDIIQQSISLAESWQNRANALLTPEEKGIQAQMKRLLTHPLDKVILTKLIDQSFRSHDANRVADQVNRILRTYGTPDFFSRVEKLLIQMFLGLGRHFPALTVPSMILQIRNASSRAIISGEPKALKAHLRERKNQGVGMNINHLGEALLGEKEAQKRLNTYFRDLKAPEIEYISIKISTIYSQISTLAFDHTVEVLKARLSAIYYEAMTHFYHRNDGSRVPKFVNLDMEEYKDMELTCQAFIRALDQAAYTHYTAGIALQAYLPDAHPVQIELTEWARKRVASGGAPIRIRLVKGANMEMEKLESALFNWPLAPYDNKLSVDANYKRMVVYGMAPENIGAANLGIASHNLFDLAYARTLAEAGGVTEYVTFEMLEGMADHVRRAISEMSGDVRLYAPVATREAFINAIAYLIRRLDENTSPENYLRDAPGLQVDSPEWGVLKERFIESCRFRNKASLGSRRKQDRNAETFSLPMGAFHENEFGNEPDTDWSLAANRRWADAVRDRWRKDIGRPPVEVPLVINGRDISGAREYRDIVDPNQLGRNIIIARYTPANEADIATAVATARADPDGWRKMAPNDRHRILSRVAVALRKARGDLIGVAAAETGKVFTETDGEISEAIDFTEFYPFSAKRYQGLGSVSARGKGVGLVISPWNFPVAIPCGGIVAMLAAGNTVIFKPSSDAVLTGWELCKCFWKAGITPKVLQFVPCSGDTIGMELAQHADIDAIILTGGTDTGLAILEKTPAIYLAAETGGKNATIVTDMADRDQAIKNVLISAFGNSGQKCSATSLLILEKQVYDDPHFREQLVDAAGSIMVGSAWHFRNKMGPLIRPPRGDLLRALTTLERDESWALRPENLEGNPNLWSPGIKWDVQPGSTTHMTEFFGPLLAVMRAKDLNHAIALVHQTGYGLTSGLESLDDQEQKIWKETVQAGNLYINRPTTGAIVLRQPFGGMGKSALGPGLKTGGPDYPAQFMDFEETGYPETGPIERDHPLLRIAREWEVKIAREPPMEHRDDLKKVIRAIRSYMYHAGQRFEKEVDYFHLRGQDNILRHLPVGKIVIRVHEDDSLFEVLARVAATRISGCIPLVSVPEGMHNAGTDFLATRQGGDILGNAKIAYEDDQDVIDRMPKVQRIRYAAADRVPSGVFAAAAEIGFYISDIPVVMEGRIELLQYYRQQAICNSYHRYGNLGDRAINPEVEK